MKFSKYNVLFNYKGKRLIYNSFTGGFGELPEEKKEIYKILEQHNESAMEILEKDSYLKKNLIIGGFVIDEEVNEIDQLKVLAGIQRFKNSDLTLTNEISYEELTQLACCSRYHFSKMFATIMGVTFSEYIQRRRLSSAAIELLQNRYQSN